MRKKCKQLVSICSICIMCLLLMTLWGCSVENQETPQNDGGVVENPIDKVEKERDEEVVKKVEVYIEDEALKGNTSGNINNGGFC